METRKKRLKIQKYKKKKKNPRQILIPAFIITACIPLAIFAIYIKHYFSGNFDAVVYDNSFILLAVQNYFSPVLAGVQNNILDFQNIWMKTAWTAGRFIS